MSYASKFCQIKDLIKIYICGKFHQYSICGCKGKSFQNFSYWFSIHKMAPFFGFWALTPPNIVRSCWNFEQRKFFNKTKTVFEKSFKILNFGPNGTHSKFTVLVHFGAQFSTRKPKILLKTKISAKTTPLGISNNVSPRSQKNHRILVKLSKKKNFFWTQLPPGALSRGYQKFSHSL